MYYRYSCSIIALIHVDSATILLVTSYSLIFCYALACSWGSIIRGQRSALVRMVAFSMDIRSLGRSSLFQRAMVAPSVSSERTSRPPVMGIGGCVVGMCVCVCV